jgi:hypothetical protein
VPEIEFITVANHAETINGLLYLQGAGWTDLVHPVGANGQPGIFHVGIGVSILIGWNETNRKYPMTIYLKSEDGPAMFEVQTVTEAGRPPGAQPGAAFRSVVAMNVEIQFPGPGGYVLGATMGEAAQEKSVSFRVRYPTPPGGPASIPPFMQMPPSGPSI